MDSQASSVSKVRTPSMSAATYASAKRLREIALLGRPRPRRTVACVTRGFQRCATPLQSSLHRCLAGLQHRRHFVGTEAEDVAQQNRCSLARRHPLQSSDERELYRLSLAVAGFRAGGARRRFRQAGCRGRAAAR